MRIRVSLIVFCLILGKTCLAATGLPVGPLTFNSNAEVESNFKYSPSGAQQRIVRDPAGYLSIQNINPGISSAVAVYDTSALGGTNGNPGTSGSDVNNDLSNFTISADVDADFACGFYLRLNNSESGGYLAKVAKFMSTGVGFNLYENASLSSSGTLVDSVIVNVPGGFVSNTFYKFSVTATGGKFDFDFGNGKAKATIIDPTVSATVGQVGIIMDPNISGPLHMDNFQIQAIPEPSVMIIGIACGIACLGWRKKNV